MTGQCCRYQLSWCREFLISEYLLEDKHEHTLRMKIPRMLCCTSCGTGPKILSMLGMTGSFMLVELIVGNWTNSMALVADSFHMLSDVIALIIAYISVRMSPRKWQKNTFGYARAEVVGALINAVFLFALCFSISVESLKRFLLIETIENPVLILIVGGVGLAINLVGMCLFGDVGHGHSHDGGGHGETTKISTVIYIKYLEVTVTLEATAMVT